MVCLEKCGSIDDLVVMPIGKNSIEEKEGRSAASPSKKKGKVHEGKDVKVKQKKRACKKFHVLDFPLDFPLTQGQSSYNLKKYLTS